jgi:hypothetical protein
MEQRIVFVCSLLRPSCHPFRQSRQVWECVALGEPGGVVHGAGAAVYPSMVGIDRFGRVGRRDCPIVEQASSYIANHPSSLAGDRAPAPPSAASGGANRHERVRNLLFGGSGRQRCDSAIRLVEAPVMFGTAAQGADHFSTYAWPDEVC